MKTRQKLKLATDCLQEIRQVAYTYGYPKPAQLYMGDSYEVVITPKVHPVAEKAIDALKRYEEALTNGNV